MTMIRFAVTGLEIIIGLDDPLQPAGAAEGQIVGHGFRIDDLELVLDPRRQGGDEIGTDIAVADVAEIVGHDDIVQGFLVNAADSMASSSRQISDVGSHLIVGGMAPFADAGDLGELVDRLLVAFFQFFTVGIKKRLV